MAVDHEATVRCCYRWKENPNITWILNDPPINGTIVPRLVNQSENVTPKKMEENSGVKCHSLVFKSIQLNYTGLYQCKLNHGSLHAFTHGTFLLVYSESDHSYISILFLVIITETISANNTTVEKFGICKMFLIFLKEASGLPRSHYY